MTHTLVGVGLANAFFRRRIGPAAVPILAIASNLPDIDTLVHFTGDPTAILMRRTLGHSIFLVPVLAMALALILRRFLPSHDLKTLFGLSLLGASVHLLFDLINSFGVVLLWPFSDWRPELAMVFIIDLFLTAFLAAPLLLCISRRTRPYLIGLSQVSIACVVVYLLFCGGNRMLAQAALAAETARAGINVDFSYVFPELLGPHRWKGVARENNIYNVYLIHSLTGRVIPIDEVRTDLDHPDVQRTRSLPLAGRLEWFFKAPVWAVEKPVSPGNNPGGERAVSVYDLRFRSARINRTIPFKYSFPIDSPGR